VLICFPSFATRSGAHQYARLAADARGEQEVWVLPAPGFRAGEPLPATVEALTLLHAADVLRCADGRPFALLGHSAGGWIAHSVAERLRQQGSPVAAVVLVDSYEPGHPVLRHIQAHLAAASATSAGEPGATDWDDSVLTALGGYARLFDLWRPGHLDGPTLLVRATDPLPGFPTADWRSRWPGSPAPDVLDVPGNHFTMTAEHAPGTLAAVRAHLATRPLTPQPQPTPKASST
jgi:pimeloyl-ACP methyl ester carboxylesterase